MGRCGSSPSPPPGLAIPGRLCAVMVATRVPPLHCAHGRSLFVCSPRLRLQPLLQLLVLSWLDVFGTLRVMTLYFYWFCVGISHGKVRA